MKKLSLLLLSIFFLGTLNGFSQKTYQPTWESIDSRPIPAWFEDAKFGIVGLPPETIVVVATVNGSTGITFQETESTVVVA